VTKPEDPVNPWLTIPAADYEGHMGSPEVGQLAFLSEVFRDALNAYQPRRLLVVGCATGNGFEHIDRDSCEGVVAVDINPEYLSVLKTRFPDAAIQTRCEDVAKCEFDTASFDLIHCALIFEYVDPSSVVGKLARWLRPGGVLVVVLQLPHDNAAAVSATPYSSLRRLEPIMRLVDPAKLERLAREVRLSELQRETRTLVSGKRFYVAVFSRRDCTPHEERSEFEGGQVSHSRFDTGMCADPGAKKANERNAPPG